MKLINLTATSFDTLASNLPDLIEIVADFKKARNGSLLFRLHPLESLVLSWLSASPHTITASDQVLHRLSEPEIAIQAKRKGYKVAEVEQIIALLGERELTYRDKYGFIVERPSVTTTLEEVTAQAELLAARLKLIERSFPEATEINLVAENTPKLNQMLRQLQSQRNKPDPKALGTLDHTIRNYLKLLDDALRGRLETVKTQCERIVKRFRTLKVPSAENLHPIEVDLPYLDDLEQARRTLVEMCSQATITVRERQTRVEEVTQHLIGGNYAQDTLPNIVAEIRAFDDGFDQLSADLVVLSTTVGAYSTWLRIASIRRAIIEKSVQFGRDGIEIGPRIEQLDNEIAARLIENWQIGLSQGDTYERRFIAMNDAIDEIEKQTNRKFQRLQDAFFAQLRSAHCPEEKLWSPIIFSQTEAERVYNQLYLYAGHATIATVDHAENGIQRLCSELRQMLASPDRERISEQANKLLSDLTAMTAQLPYLAANDPQTINEFDGQSAGVFTRLISQVKNTLKEIQIYEERVISLNSRIEELPLSPTESEINRRLQDGSPTDLVVLWEQYGANNSDSIWLAVRTLWEKGLIQITIRKLR